MKLKDIFEKPISGEWGKEVGEGEKGSKVIRTTNFTNIGRLDLSSIVERDIDSIKHENKKLKFGDIIIEKSGGSPTQPVGRVVIFEETNEDVYFCNNFTSILRPNKNIVPKFGLYLLKNLYNKKKVLKFQNKTTGIINIKLNDYLNNTEITIPNLEVQNRIAEVLNKTQELIDKRKEQIESLDELVKSKFIEMFGDPVTNLKKWDKVAIGEMFEIKTGATPSRKENSYWEGGTIPWVKTTELKEYIINETEEYITEDGFNNSSVNLLPKDTILIAMYGQGKTRGMTGKLGIEATTNQACAAILPNNNENMDFVWYQLRLLYDELRALGQGGSQPNLNTNLVKTYQLIFPPVELQNEFERFIKHIDKLKFEMEKSLKELEDNFNSLMQKAFRGELFK
ncbi:MAG: restriction endonuclease subunit S [Clostridium perfringens]|uniref:Restriction endonuclease subunit S n=1 Tax=Clostridium perfringens TaxID=1502 RepID=A0AAW9K5J6_CLOPF|nr:restriction endonuclease subunit S [Clostridium perfringens]MDZ7540896.1 restriction endonuclease subunit S [Clostridium perfringens]